jgi:transcriptional regulator with XRE-family HTH domain
MTEVSQPRRGRPRSKSRPAPVLNRGQAELRGTPLAAVAQAAGCSKKSASRWLRGDKIPDDEHAARLEQAFGVSPRAWHSAATSDEIDEEHDAWMLDESQLGLIAHAVSRLIEEPQLPLGKRAGFLTKTVAGLPPSVRSALLPAFEEWQAEL